MNNEARYQEAQARLLVSDAALGNVFPHWFGDRSFWFVETTAGARTYWNVDAETGGRKELFDHEALATQLREQSEQSEEVVAANALRLQGVRVTDGGETILFGAFGTGWKWSTAGASLAKHETSVPKNSVASPDGRLHAFVRSHNLWVHEEASGREWALTTDGIPNFGYAWGPSARWKKAAANSEAGAPVQVVWSDDSKRILTVRYDEREVATHSCVDYVPADGSPYEAAYELRWARPGDANVPQATVYAIDVASTKSKVARYNPVPAVRMNDSLIEAGLLWWGDDASQAYFVDIERGEKTAHVVEFDTQTGDCRRVFTEKSDALLELGLGVYSRTNVHAIRGSNEVLWCSERSGLAQLYLYNLTSGELVCQVTNGRGRVLEVLKVDSVRREVFFTAARWEDGAGRPQRVVRKASLDSGVTTDVANGPGDHEVIGPATFSFVGLSLFGEVSHDVHGVSPNCDYLIASVGTVQGGVCAELRRRDGTLVSVLAKSDVATLSPGWVAPEPFEAVAADGVTPLYGVILKPADFDPSKKYPLIDYIYGGPQVMHAPLASHRAFELIGLSTPNALAALGFVVVIVDGRGTAGRSRKFHSHGAGAVHRASDIDDHVSAIEQLAKSVDYIDIDRVGISGFSAGGMATAHAMLARPDFFKVGVAGGGNYDQRVFWNTWGERYHGLMDGDNFESQSLKKLASRLEGKLLFVHGLMDHGCVLAGLMQLVQALHEADKEIDVLVEPRMPHEVSGYGYRKTWDYFVTNLAGEKPPARFRIRTTFDQVRENLVAWSSQAKKQAT